MRWTRGPLALAAAALTLACSAPPEPATRVTGGDPERGRVAIRQYACQTCHYIPGVTGADSLAGPPLGGIADRMYLAGIMPNTAANMVKWLERPHAVAPLSAMPDLGVTRRDARDIAAYLYTLH